MPLKSHTHTHTQTLSLSLSPPIIFLSDKKTQGFIHNKNSKQKVKLSPFSRGQPEGSLYNSNYTEVYERALLLSLDCPHFTLDTYLILLSVKQGGIKYHF